MPQALHQFERIEFALGFGMIERAEDDLDRRLDAPGRLGLPNFSEAAAAEPLDEFVPAGNGRQRPARLRARGRRLDSRA